MVETASSQVPTKVILLPGKPRFVQLGSKDKELIIQTNPMSAVSLVRHYNPNKPGTELCQCDGPCSSQREDTFVSALEWVGPMTYEQRLWCISEAALAELWRHVKANTDSLEWKGVNLKARRTGPAANARVCLTWLQKFKTVPEGFDVPWAVLKATGIATAFFKFPPVVPDQPNADQVVTPARARADKPRVSKGCGNCHKRKEVLE